MDALFEKNLLENRDAVSELCRKLEVKSLRVFGSATGNIPLKTSSDLDFVVAFFNGTTAGIADRFLSLAEELESVFRRRVDLLTERSLRNPVLRDTIQKESLPIFEA